MLGKSEQDAGEYTCTTGGRRRDDYSHRRVHFLHREGGSENIGEDGSGERAHSPVELRGIAPYEAGDAHQVADQAARDSLLHHLERTRKRGLHLGAAAETLSGFGDERQLSQGDSARLRLFHRLSQGVEHQAILGIERIMLTAGIARMASIA
jgi:hypothetical protein